LFSSFFYLCIIIYLAAYRKMSGEETVVINPTEDVPPQPATPEKKGTNLRNHFKRMNTVASATPFQEFSTNRLDTNNYNGKEKEKEKEKEDEALKKRADSEERQVKEVKPPPKDPLTLNETFVNDKPDYRKLKVFFAQEGKLDMEAATALVERATAIFKTEPNVLELEAPYTVCGDIHGQYYDLVNLFDNSGDPESTPYLFLGDYVDRGCFSCEVLFLMLAMKISFPTTFHMLRGNHESRAMTNIHNFKVECLKKYNDELYKKVMQCFDCLPLAAVLNCKMLGRFFCVHGGLSPRIETLNDIKELYRFDEVPQDSALTDLLWSDPILEDEEMSTRDILEFRELEYADNVERGIGYFFGFKAITDFLLKNNIVSIVRAHEVQQDGCTEHMFTRTDTSIPMVFTVFSAPNYCDFYSNKGAFIKFNHNKYEIYQLECVPHPYWLPDFQNVFAFSIDYVLDAVHSVLKSLSAKEKAGEEPDSDWLHEAKSDYMKKLTTFQARVRSNSVCFEEGLSAHEKFKKAKQLDLSKEKISPKTASAGNAKNRQTLKRHQSSYF